MGGGGWARTLRPLPQRRNFHVRTGAGGGDAHGAERAGGKKTGIGEVCDVGGCVWRPQRGRRLRRGGFFLRPPLVTICCRPNRTAPRWGARCADISRSPLGASSKRKRTRKIVLSCCRSKRQTLPNCCFCRCWH